jgi:dysferlin
MVEIDMTPGELPETKIEEIKIADQKRACIFMRRRKYKLFAAFFSATCVYPYDAPVEFEVSIGEIS